LGQELEDLDLPHGQPVQSREWGHVRATERVVVDEANPLSLPPRRPKPDPTRVECSSPA
jgi:hypothetical protein